MLYPTQRYQGTDNKSAWAMACKTYDTYFHTMNGNSPQLSGLARCHRSARTRNRRGWKASAENTALRDSRTESSYLSKPGVASGPLDGIKWKK